jgi:MYXO-CTERM domain-containing protein
LALRSLDYGCWGPFRGQFLDRQRGALIGFKFNNGTGVQYGWARLKMTEFPDYDPDFPDHNIELVDYAYADPGEKIVAGKMSESSAPTLQSLGALALGATALAAWRRRRSA